VFREPLGRGLDHLHHVDQHAARVGGEEVALAPGLVAQGSNDVDPGLSKSRLLGRGVGDKKSQYQPARALAESVRDRLVIALQEAQLVGAPSVAETHEPAHIAGHLETEQVDVEPFGCRDVVGEQRR
jgi:hypothetical protein